MKYILLIIACSLTLFAENKAHSKTIYTTNVVPKKMSVATKKARFYAIVIPAVNKVYKELFIQYLEVKESLRTGKNLTKINKLKKLYKVQSNEELLLALKPHSKSITLAQAAIESAWGTSRFFIEAKNLFGVWSINTKEPRIAANKKRKGKHTIWLRKFSSVEESIRAYYLTIARVKAYKKFRLLRSQTDDVYSMVKGLNNYSEMGEEYTLMLSSLIHYNKLTRYDK